MLTPILIASLYGMFTAAAPAMLAEPAVNPVEARAVWHDDETSEPFEIKIVTVSGDGSGPQQQVVMRPIDAAAGGNPAAPRIMKFRSKSEDLPAGGPWLGIQFGPIPKPLATHLGLSASEGQMVLNVAETSPADIAGFQQFDVITQIDGQSVPAEMVDFLKRVREFVPNQPHTFTIRRGGQQVTVNVTVGARPENPGAVKYKYEQPMEEMSMGRVFGRGGMLGKDDSGNWVFKGLDMQNMPDFFKAMPDASQFGFNIPVPPDGSGNRIFMHSTEGEQVQITRDDDGKITIVRTTKEGDNSSTTSTTYNDYEEFKAKEPELSKRFVFLGDGAKAFEFWVPEGLDHLQQLGPDWADKLHEHLKDLPHAGAFIARPMTRFEVDPNGQIKVTTRSGEDEIVETFSNAGQLQSSRPDLYKKFEKFQARQSQRP